MVVLPIQCRVWPLTSPLSGHSHRKVSQKQTVQRLHRAGATAERVWPLQEALWEVSGVQSRKLHHLDQVFRAGDHPGRHRPGQSHIWTGHWTTATRHARGLELHISPYLQLLVPSQFFSSIFSLYHTNWAIKAWCIKYDSQQKAIFLKVL